MTRRYTLNKMNNDSSGGKAKVVPQFVAALCVCMGAVAAGTVLGWTSNISDKMKLHSDLNDIPIDDTTWGWIGSLSTIGGMVVCFPIGWLCDLIGRKWGCLVTVVPFTVGWILIICSSNTGMIYAGRFLTGLAGGAFCVAAPIYTSEISQVEVRGTLGNFFQLLLTVGILIAYLGGAYMSVRDLSILCAVIPICFAVLFFFQPETPIYLVRKKREADAIESLKKLRGQAYDYQEELKEIKASVEEGESNKVSFFEACNTTPARKAIFICFGLMLFQQFSGVNAVIFYTGDIFTAAKSSLSSSTATIIVGVMQVIATFVSSLVVDRFGRKILLLLSVIFMMLSDLALGIFFTIQDKGNTDNIQFLPILSLIVFIVMFSMGFGPIPWMISAELMPPDIKSTACSAAATFNWVLAFLVTRFYADLKTAIGGDATFYIFSGFCALGTAFVVLVVPETKGKSIAQVQIMLGGNARNVPVADENYGEKEQGGIDNPTFKV